MSHGHQHKHGSEGTNARRLWMTLSLVVVYMVVEVVGGLFADSLALIATLATCCQMPARSV
jgi:Co/Zn/Cd efflux system component